MTNEILKNELLLQKLYASKKRAENTSKETKLIDDLIKKTNEHLNYLYVKDYQANLN